MKNLLILFLITFLFSSCFKDKERLIFVCSCSQMDEVQEFVGNHIEDANNKSDEEMEDVISELYRTGVKLNCEQRIFITDHHGYFIPSKNKLDSCETMTRIYY